MISKNQIRFIRSLDRKKERLASGCFVCEGVRCVHEILRSSLRVLSVYGTEAWMEKYGDRVDSHTECHTVLENELKAISFLKTPHQVVAVVQIPPLRFVPSHLMSGWTVGLDNIQDPGNLGTIVRLADWYNIHHVLCSRDTADVFNPKVVQASMGSIARVQVHYLDLEVLFRDHPAVPVIAATLAGEPITRADLPGYGIVLFGNEGEGITPGLLGHVTRQVLIPRASPHPVVDSINVTAAAAIVLYELHRRQSTY